MIWSNWILIFFSFHKSAVSVTKSVYTIYYSNNIHTCIHKYVYILLSSSHVIFCIRIFCYKITKKVQEIILKLNKKNFNENNYIASAIFYASHMRINKQVFFLHYYILALYKYNSLSKNKAYNLFIFKLAQIFLNVI